MFNKKMPKRVLSVSGVVLAVLGLGILLGNTEINIGVNNQVNTGKIVGYGCNEGSGVVQTEQRAAGLFKKISLDGSFDVTIVCGGEVGITVTAESNLHSHIKTDVDRDTLHVTTTGSFCTSNPLLVEIVLEKLDAIMISGTSEVVVDCSSLHHDKLSIDMRGTSSMSITGKGKKVDIALQDAAELDASQFESEDVVINTSGVAAAKILVTGSLSAKSSDASEVHYTGHPVILKMQALDASEIVGEDEAL